MLRERRGMKAPSSRHKAPKKRQVASSKATISFLESICRKLPRLGFGVWPLAIPWSFALGAWCLLLLSGCSTPPQLPRPVRAFPPEAFITQRAVLTALGKQYTMNGYLARSEARGMRLLVTENFGNVLADVLVQRDGTVRVMRSSAALREKWIERHVAADLQCLFGQAAADCPGVMIGPDHFMIERRWYKLDLRIVETKAGPQPAAMFEAAATSVP